MTKYLVVFNLYLHRSGEDSEDSFIVDNNEVPWPTDEVALAKLRLFIAEHYFHEKSDINNARVTIKNLIKLD